MLMSQRPPCSREVVDAHDVRARHLAREQQLLAEALERVGPARELGPQQLQRDIDVERQVVRAIDDAHAADAEQRSMRKRAAEQIARAQLGAGEIWPVRVAAPCGAPGSRRTASLLMARTIARRAASGQTAGSAAGARYR